MLSRRSEIDPSWTAQELLLVKFAALILEILHICDCHVKVEFVNQGLYRADVRVANSTNK
jgi:hypothetical protein